MDSGWDLILLLMDVFSVVYLEVQTKSQFSPCLFRPRRVQCPQAYLGRGEPIRCCHSPVCLPGLQPEPQQAGRALQSSYNRVQERLRGLRTFSLEWSGLVWSHGLALLGGRHAGDTREVLRWSCQARCAAWAGSTD